MCLTVASYSANQQVEVTSHLLFVVQVKGIERIRSEPIHKHINSNKNFEDVTTKQNIASQNLFVPTLFQKI